MTHTDQDVLTLLATHTYDQVKQVTGYSRGRIYSIACRHGARKTEQRIQERAAERRQRQREMLADVIDRVATSDVLDYMDGLPDESVDLAIFSPPYNVSKPYSGSTTADSMGHVVWWGWMAQIIGESARVLKPRGVLALQVGSTFDHRGRLVPIDLLLNDVIDRAGLDLQNRIIWEIPHGLTPRGRLSGRHETIMVSAKGGAPRVFNPTPARTPQRHPDKKAFKGPRKGQLSSHPLGAWPSDVWRIGNVGHNHPERSPAGVEQHPAQMPEELARRVVQLYTNPGDLVIDPFMGSGTTAAVCIQTGRRFSGCDLSYEDTRAVRLAEAGLADMCPLPGVSDRSVAAWRAQATRIDHEPGDLFGAREAA